MTIKWRNTFPSLNSYEQARLSFIWRTHIAKLSENHVVHTSGHFKIHVLTYILRYVIYTRTHTSLYICVCLISYINPLCTCNFWLLAYLSLTQDSVLNLTSLDLESNTTISYRKSSSSNGKNEFTFILN